jgi:hypothetical protein
MGCKRIWPPGTSHSKQELQNGEVAFLTPELPGSPELLNLLQLLNF